MQITYNLDTGTVPFGYDLTSINTYAGWRDPGRSEQDYTVLYSTVNAPNTFRVLDSVFAPAYGGYPSDTTAFLTSGTGILASNVAAIQFSFPTTQNGYVGYRELDVLGLPSSVPIPKYGGGLYNGSGDATVVNCTFSGNTASTGGGGLYIAGGTATLANTIVAGNNNDISGTVSGSYNLIGTGGSGGLVNGTNGNQVGVANPGLGPLQDNGGPTWTMALLPGSPAIDAGDRGGRGNHRPARDQPDDLRCARHRCLRVRHLTIEPDGRQRRSGPAIQRHHDRPAVQSVDQHHDSDQRSNDRVRRQALLRRGPD